MGDGGGWGVLGKVTAQGLEMWPLLKFSHYGKRELAFWGAIYNQQTVVTWIEVVDTCFSQIYATGWQVSRPACAVLFFVDHLH